MQKEEGIKVIENSFLELQARQDILLVYLREKPSMQYPSRNEYYKKEGKDFYEEALKEFNEKKESTKKMLGFLEIPFYFEEVEKEKFDYSIKEGYRFLAGRDENSLINLREALKTGSSKKIGLALGYPETAVNAFVEGEILDKYDDLRFLPQNEKDALKEEGVFKFVSFGLSKNNWREELELVRKYQEAIKKNAPNLYKEIIAKRKDFL